MRASTVLIVSGFGLLVTGGNALAADRTAPPQTPLALQRLLQCRSLAATEQRLACFDRESATLGSDIERKELVVVDRGQIARTRRTLFGLQLPRLDILGDAGDNDIKQIESTVQGFGPNSDGGLLFALADGSRWSQTDSTTLDVPPRRGDKVKVRRAALGSFLLAIDGLPPMKVKRVQ